MGTQGSSCLSPPPFEGLKSLRRGADDDIDQDLLAAQPPSTPKAVKYGRKAQVFNKMTTTSLLLVAGSVNKKKKNVNMRKVALMSKKEQEDTKSKVRSIRSFFMTLTDDPKLKKEGGVKLPSGLGGGGDGTVPG